MAGPGQDTPEQNNPSDETREGIKPAPVAADKTKLLEPYLQQQLGNSNGQNNPFRLAVNQKLVQALEQVQAGKKQA